MHPEPRTTAPARTPPAPRAGWSGERNGTEIVGEFLKTFKDFPPRQRAASFTIDQAMEKMEMADSGALR